MTCYRTFMEAVIGIRLKVWLRAKKLGICFWVISNGGPSGRHTKVRAATMRSKAMCKGCSLADGQRRINKPGHTGFWEMRQSHLRETKPLLLLSPDSQGLAPQSLQCGFCQTESYEENKADAWDLKAARISWWGSFPFNDHCKRTPEVGFQQLYIYSLLQNEFLTFTCTVPLLFSPCLKFLFYIL